MKQTKAKILSVFLSLCLVVSCMAGLSVTVGAEDDPVIIVSLGDSYSSGEGIEPFYGQEKESAEKVQDEDWLAHRSTKAWGGQLTSKGFTGTASTHRGSNWYFVAASSAETKHLTGTFTKEYQYDDLTGSKDLPAQLDILNGLTLTANDFITVTIGGNDIGFVEIMALAMTQEADYLQTEVNSKLELFDSTIKDDLRSAYRNIAVAAGSQATIIVAGYPHLMNPAGFTYSIFGMEKTVSNENSGIINNAVDEFNSKIEALVSECADEGMNICFVSVTDGFDGHEAYTDDPYINAFSFGAGSQDINQSLFINGNSFHPNERGAAVYAAAVQAKIDQLEAASLDPVPYIDENGAEQTCETYTVVTDSTTTWDEGWYVVNNNVDITGQIEISGNVNLILTDGNSLKVTSDSNTTIYGDSASSLTIYGQSSGTGTLNAISERYALTSGKVTINGGNVNADGNRLGIYSDKDLTITGGEVTARGNNDGIYTEGNVTISGGTVIANGGESENASAGIYAFRGNIEITGGIVEASSGNNGINSTLDIKISGGTVNANGGYDGIWASGNLTISGGRVTAGGEQHGFYADDEVTISGGTVEATATGTEEEFYGIQADSGVVTIGEGVDSLTVSGGNKAIGGSVKNAVAGTGWTDVKGTEGQADIKVSSEGQTLDNYKKVQFPAAEKPAAAVITAPAARILTYTGQAQELVTAGTAEGGEMQYSLDGKTFSTAIPTATEAGTYTVYYKAAGDANHSDTGTQTLTVTVGGGSYIQRYVTTPSGGTSVPVAGPSGAASAVTTTEPAAEEPVIGEPVDEPETTIPDEPETTTPDEPEDLTEPEDAVIEPDDTEAPAEGEVGAKTETPAVVAGEDANPHTNAPLAGLAVLAMSASAAAAAFTAKKRKNK